MSHHNCHLLKRLSGLLSGVPEKKKKSLLATLGGDIQKSNTVIQRDFDFITTMDKGSLKTRPF